MRTIEIQIPEGKIAKWVNNTLTLEDDPQNPYGIRTFGDALDMLGNDNPLVSEYHRLTINCAPSKETRAYLKLKIITEALNMESAPYNDKYYVPVFNIFTGNGKMSEEEREEAVTVAGEDNTDIHILVHCVYAYYMGDSSHIGTPFLFNTRDIAKYAATRFADIWADYLSFFQKRP